MPENVWYLLVGGGIIAVLLALTLGRKLVIRRDIVEVNGGVEPTPGGINVGKGMKVSGSKLGDVVGVSTTSSTLPSEASIDVLSGAEIADSELGDVAGVKSQTKR
jgi:hypothetical protein